MTSTVNCIEVCCVISVVVEMVVDGNHDEHHPNIVHLPTRKVTSSVHFPMPWDGPMNENTRRNW